MLTHLIFDTLGHDKPKYPWRQGTPGVAAVAAGAEYENDVGLRERAGVRVGGKTTVQSRQ